jgi:hypothetical protein
MNFDDYDYQYDNLDDDFHTFNTQKSGFLEYGTHHALLKSNSNKISCKDKEDEQEESVFNEGNNESKVDDIDENNTKSTCIDFECRDITDDDFEYPDVDGINFSTHLNLLLELEEIDDGLEKSEIHHMGLECNCNLKHEDFCLQNNNNTNLILPSEIEPVSINQNSRKNSIYTASTLCSRNHTNSDQSISVYTNNSVLNQFHSYQKSFTTHYFKDNPDITISPFIQSSLFNNTYLKSESKILQDQDSLRKSRYKALKKNPFRLHKIGPTEYEIKVSNVIDYSIALLKHAHSKMLRSSKNFPKSSFIKFSHLLSSFLNCKISVSGAEISTYRENQQAKGTEEKKFKKELFKVIHKKTDVSVVDVPGGKKDNLSKDSNLRKRLKLLFNKKIVCLLDIFILLITNSKFKALPQINHTDPHKKNNTVLFDTHMIDLFSPNSKFSIKRSLITLFNNKDIIKSLMQFDQEIMTEKLILLELLKAMMYSKYGKLAGIFFTSEQFLTRDKNIENLPLEGRFDELGKTLYEYMSKYD